MKNILKNRLALSTVVTTLIILVVSVLLAGVVTYFAINVTSTRVQEENLSLSKQHIWVNQAGTAVAAIMVTNTGGRDVVISKIAVRGQAAAAADIFYVVAGTGDVLTTDLNWTGAAKIAGDDIVGGITSDGLTALGTNTLVLTSGSTMAIYLNNPDSINVNDIGLTVAITVFTSQAIHYKETNVEAVV
ncbi:MAG: hypothetical protein NWE99_05775 [Candidatus Bathyarchaeota archaeon]|nr:hypothetical protein [Candidatus Bathyarchaeota archaeon]